MDMETMEALGPLVAVGAVIVAVLVSMFLARVLFQKGQSG